MSGRDLNTFNTSYKAEDVGKSAENVTETLQTGDIEPHWSVEQIIPKSPCWILHVLSCFKDMTEAALLVFIHLLFRVTAELLKKLSDTALSLSFLSSSCNLLVLICCLFVFTSVPFFAKKRFSAIPIAVSFLSSMQKSWHSGWKMVLAAQSTNRQNMKDCKLLLMPNAWSLI